MRLLVIDTETSGTDPSADHLLEIGWATYDTELAAVVDGGWRVFNATGNAAEHINGIPEALVQRTERKPNWQAWERLCREHDALVAHNAAFDRQWFPEANCAGRPWVCTVQDWDWPLVQGQSRRLIDIALGLGVGVVRAHRAIEDVLTLCACFTALARDGHVLEVLATEAVLEAQSPRVTVRCACRYEDRDRARALGYRWDPARKVWSLTCSARKAQDLGERTRAAGLPVRIEEEGGAR